jgi:hypothetical protein
MHRETGNLERQVIGWPPQQGGNFDEFKSGGLHEKRAAATWNYLSICLKTEKIQENLCRDGRSQDLPDAY